MTENVVIIGKNKMFHKRVTGNEEVLEGKNRTAKIKESVRGLEE